MLLYFIMLYFYIWDSRYDIFMLYLDEVLINYHNFTSAMTPAYYTGIAAPGAWLDMCAKDIGLCAQNFSTMLGSMVNIVIWSSDNKESLHFDNEYDFHELKDHEENVYVHMRWVC